MNIVQLKYFIEIADTKSLTIASQNLFVTQPTLSQSLKKLEDSLNTKLLIRTDNLYQLTESGKLLYDDGKKIIQSMEELKSKMYHLNIETKKEKISLGITTLFSLQFMEQISKFMALYPSVELFIMQDGSRELQKMLKNKLLNVALLSLPNFIPDHIHIEPFKKTTTTGYNVYVVLPDDNPLSNSDQLTFEDLREEKFSSLTENFVIGKMLKDRTKELGYEPNIIAYHNDLQVLLHSLEKSNSITLLPIEYNEIYDTPNLNGFPSTILKIIFRLESDCIEIPTSLKIS
ncbi:LysR family transcriptional regulator [Tetragenococcus halophilus]|uniref:LysR family transcriptional regulator n=1 Tax=Tetragenococcus halophilus TaxID=51669 RepID=UPI0030F29382